MGVKIKVNPQQGALLPVYQSLEAAGADVHAFLEKPLVLNPMCREAIPTGLSFDIPQGYEIQIRPRSGLAIKHGITCLNTPGTIDSDYRGEVKIILINVGSESFTINNGDRIAQLILAPVVQADFEKASTLSQTKRGDKGFGSTGI